ncbi:hypothetical protein BDR07DRAFT_1611530 [Suillus spraguei]|nr:hypothetical protein BDR07DRAFT_1611530 [Suillus spraguei]
MICHQDPAVLTQERQTTLFLILILLLVILVSLTECDIRVINVVNPFYAAAYPLIPQSLRHPKCLHFSTKKAGAPFKWLFLLAISSVSLMHCNQVGKHQGQTTILSTKSNIVAVSVCPRLLRSDAIAPLLIAVRGRKQYMYTLPPALPPPSQNPRHGTNAPEELLKAGALYRGCAVVHLRIPSNG